VGTAALGGGRGPRMPQRAQEAVVEETNKANGINGELPVDEGLELTCGWGARACCPW
jgi:hypothetical protein